jgi:uncharacterized protein (DUF2147 family)
MYRILLFSFLMPLCSFVSFAQSDTILGVWKTVDDTTGEEKSKVFLYKDTDGKIYGKIVGITDPARQESTCDHCNGSKKGQPIMGMVIIEGLQESDAVYEGGTILDPQIGKVYKCKLWRENNQLKVRGYWGFLYRTQTWLPDS